MEREKDKDKTNEVVGISEELAVHEQNEENINVVTFDSLYKV